jgi:tetratricopeptide (TPR) repeat protein
MKRISKKILLLLLVIGLLKSCTIISLLTSLDMSSRESLFRDWHYECANPSESIQIPYIYSGIKSDMLYLMWPSECGWGTGELSGLNNAVFVIFVAPLCVIDIPFSFVADTVMLPYTIMQQNKEGNIVDPPYLKMGLIQERMGNNEKAREFYEKGMKVLPKYYGTKPYYEIHLPNFYEALNWLANYYTQIGDYDKAIFYSEQLLEITLHWAHNYTSREIEQCYKKIGWLYSKTGKDEKAVFFNKKATEYSQKK